MSHEIIIPSVGESITSGFIAQWHVADGDAVAVGSPLITLETDKVSTELAADVAGVVSIITPAGEEVPIGAVIGTIAEGAVADAAPAAPAPAASAPPAEEAEVEAAPSPAAEEEPAAEEVPVESEVVVAEPVPEPVTEKAVTTPPPSAPTVPAAAPPAPAEPPRDPATRTTRKRMSPLRRKIANHLVSAQQNAALLTTFNEVDMFEVMKLRKEVQEKFVANYDVKLGFMSFFIKAAVDALKAVPAVNGQIEGDEIITNHYYDIGVAVGTEKGLVVPVVRDCEEKSFADIEKAIGSYAGRARDNKLALEDLQGGVFTISNGGIYGSMLSTPILNPPQSAILGMHNIIQRPIAIDGEVVVRPMMYLALSYDHRLIDGKEAVTFLNRIKDCIENPARLLVGA